MLTGRHRLLNCLHVVPAKGEGGDVDDAKWLAAVAGVPTHCHKEELGARDEAVSGNKAWLCRRLHAAIMRDHLDDERDDERADERATEGV